MLKPAPVGLRTFLAEPSPPDWLVAGLFVASGLLEILIRHPLSGQEVGLGIASSVSLIGFAWWRTRPLIPLVLLTGSAVGIVWAGSRVMLAVPQIALPFATYSLGSYGTRRALAAGAALPIAMAIGIDLILPRPPVPWWDGLAYIGVFMTAAPILGGRLVRSRAQLVTRLKQQHGALADERKAREKQALEFERKKISSELSRIVHETAALLADEIGHAQSLHGPDGLRAVHKVEVTARQALQQLRLALNQSGQTESAPEVQLEDAIASARAARGSHDHSNQTDVSLAATPARLTSRADRGEPAPRLRWSSLREVALLRWPALVSVALIAACELQIALSSDVRGPLWLNLTVAPGVGLPIAWSRSRPLAAAAGSLAAAAAMSVFLTPLPIASVEAVLLCLYLPFRLGMLEHPSQAVVGVVLLVAGYATAFGLFSIFEVAPFLAGSWAVAWLIGERTRLARELHETNQRLGEERDLRAKEAVLEERARVARELHDVIGHMLTVIVLQAGAARRNWISDPERAARALDAMAEVTYGGLRQLLSGLEALSAPGADEGSPGLRDIEGLVLQAQSTGFPVDLTLEPAVTRAGAAAQFAAYRIVQESLTNVLKHAPGSRVGVRIHAADSELEIVVENTPPSVDGQPSGANSGSGLAGMAARVAALGGLLRWGHEPDGGFAVRATLPLRN